MIRVFLVLVVAGVFDFTNPGGFGDGLHGYFSYLKKIMEKQMVVRTSGANGNKIEILRGILCFKARGTQIFKTLNLGKQK